MILNNNNNEWITTLLKRDFKDPFFKEIVDKLKRQEYKIKVI